MIRARAPRWASGSCLSPKDDEEVLRLAIQRSDLMRFAFSKR